MDGRVALVTGGSRGLGQGVAQALHSAGATVLITGRSPEKGAQAAAELGDATFLAGDARTQADVEGWIDAAVERFGGVDILVNNAGGMSGFAYVADVTDEAWAEAADWILNSAFWATRRALPSMRENRWGRVINMSSVEGKVVKKPMISPYSTFKHALNGFTKAVAAEYGSSGVTCNAICPGAVDTDYMRASGGAAAEASGISYDQMMAMYARETLTGKVTTIEEVAAVARLLASEAGAGITGTTINVDGGTSPY